VRSAIECTGGESPEVRRENDEFESLLMAFSVEEMVDPADPKCPTGIEPDCPPETQLRARLSQLGPAAVNWLATLSGEMYGALKSSLQELGSHKSSLDAVETAMLLPMIIAPEVGGAAIVLERAALRHVARRHFAGTTATNVSKFIGAFGSYEGLVGIATLAAKVQPTIVDRFNSATGQWMSVGYRVIEFERAIGYDRDNGNALMRFVTVVTKPTGELITMIPGFPASVLRPVP
jgi:hypothetical protein